MRHHIAMAALALVATTSRAHAQLPVPAAPGAPALPADGASLWTWIPDSFSGEILTTGEFYRHGGLTTARRPGALLRTVMNPQLTLFGSVSMGVSAALSTEGSELRQNINLLGFNPSYRGVTVHAGDFTRDYSDYTITGTNVRGFGVDVAPGNFLFSVQTGRAQRTVAAGSDGAAYQRRLLAASVGYGQSGGNRLALTILKAKDDPNSLEQSLVVVDTTVSDTTLVPEPLKFAAAPQENLVLALESELHLFNDMLSLRGKLGASLFTRDLRSQIVDDAGLGALGAVSALQPLRLSTSGDNAYAVDAEFRRGIMGLRGGIELIGPGYTSLGLPSLINDRQGYNVGGNVALFDSRLSLLGETRSQIDNIQDQRAARTERGTNMLSAALSVTSSTSTSLTLLTNRAATEVSPLAAGIDLHMLALTGAVSTRASLFARPTSVSIAYGYQTSRDALPATLVPNVVGQNVTVTVLSALSKDVSLGPSFSGVLNKVGDGDSDTNLLFGFAGRARLFNDGRGGGLNTSANLSNTFSAGRQVRSARAEASYSLPWETRLSVQARHTSYTAFATRPAFNESFLTIGMTRSLEPSRSR
jgi:hypothetical protein